MDSISATSNTVMAAAFSAQSCRNKTNMSGVFYINQHVCIFFLFGVLKRFMTAIGTSVGETE